MKKLFLFPLLLLALALPAQDDMKRISHVKVTIAGLEEGTTTIGKSKLLKLERLELSGAEAKKYKIVSYNFNYTGERGITEAGMEGDAITSEVNEFFRILEKDCRISFKEVLIRNTETNKLFKLAPLVLSVKAGE